MEISLIVLPAVILVAVIFIAYVLRGKSLARRDNARILGINSWLNDALSWVLLKSDSRHRALFLPAWLDALNECSLKEKNGVAISFESIDRSAAAPDTQNILIEPESGSHDLKFRIDLKIPDLIFKINIKHFTNANPKSMIATVPLIEGNVTVLISYDKEPARVEVKFTCPPNIQLTLHDSDPSLHPLDGEKVVIPLLKQIIASAHVTIPLVLLDALNHDCVSKLDSNLSPKRRIRTVKRIGADGTTVTATTVTTEKPVYDNSLLLQNPLTVEKVEEELVLMDDAATEDALPSDPGVTGLAVRDLLSQPLADSPHKATNQKRLAYTITVTSLQKEPSENNPQQLPVQDGDEFEPNFMDDATARRLSADKQRPIKLVRTLKRHLSFSKKHRRSMSSSDVTPMTGYHGNQGNGAAGDFYQYELPADEHIAFAGNSDGNAAAAKKKKRSLSAVSDSVRNLFRRKWEKSLTSDHDPLADDLIATPGVAAEAKPYETSTFPRQKKVPVVANA